MSTTQLPMSEASGPRQLVLQQQKGTISVINASHIRSKYADRIETRKMYLGCLNAYSNAMQKQNVEETMASN